MFIVSENPRHLGGEYVKKTGKKVTLLTPPEDAQPPAPTEKQQRGKVPPSRIPKGLLRPPEP
jgi:hypothetical protein